MAVKYSAKPNIKPQMMNIILGLQSLLLNSIVWARAYTWWAPLCAASYRGKKNGQAYVDDENNFKNGVICFNSSIQE